MNNPNYLEYQYHLYLQRVKLKEYLLPTEQQVQLKRAFMGACSQLLALFNKKMKSDEPAENIFQMLEDMVAETVEFWRAESENENNIKNN